MEKTIEKAADITALENKLDKLVFLAYEQHKLLMYHVLGNKPSTDEIIKDFKMRYNKLEL